LGFAIGTLYAQKKGALLRKEIKECFSDLQKNGAEAVGEVQRKSREIVEKASPAIIQAKEEAKILQCEGEELVRITSASLQEAYGKSQSALKRAHEKIADKAAPAVAQVKDEAEGLRDRAARCFKKVADTGKEKAMSVVEQIGRKCKERIGKGYPAAIDQKNEETQPGKSDREVSKAPGSPLYEVRASRAVM